MTNEKLIKEAIKIVNPKIINDSQMGDVGCVLITDNDLLFKGVCIHTFSGMGFCAEHTAISQMITQGEYKIKKIVAVWKNKKGEIYIISPCGRCREFMYQTNKKNLDTDVILDVDKVIKLKDLLPYCESWKKVR